MTADERAKSILAEITKVENHPSAQWNPRAWTEPRSITFEDMERLIAAQIREAEREAYGRVERIIEARLQAITVYDPDTNCSESLAGHADEVEILDDLLETVRRLAEIEPPAESTDA